MSRRRSRNAVEDQSGERNWSQLFSVGLLVGSVVLAMLIGVVLHVDAPETGRATQAELPAPATRPVTAPPPAERELPPAPAGLTERLTSDRRRLAGKDDDWTAQLALLCDRDRAELLLRRFGDLPALYVISADHGGRSCYRVCWNHYASLAAARSADDLPGTLRGVSSQPTPKRVGEILR